MPAKIMSDPVIFSAQFQKRFVSGHDFSRAAKVANDEGFSPCGSSSSVSIRLRGSLDRATRQGTLLLQEPIKPSSIRFCNGTGEPVPFVESSFFRSLKGRPLQSAELSHTLFSPCGHLSVPSGTSLDPNPLQVDKNKMKPYSLPKVTQNTRQSCPNEIRDAYSPGSRSRRSFAWRSLTTNSVSCLSAITSTKVLRS